MVFSLFLLRTRAEDRSLRQDLRVRPSSGSRLPGIEGLRAIAACSILVFHSWLFSPPGRKPADLGALDRYMPDLAFGVVLFFTLSGFLLYRPFAAAILRGESVPSIGRYFRNRALRILPAYWSILLFCAIVLGSALFWSGSGELVNGRLLDPDVLVRAAFFLQGYFTSTLLAGIGPAWSLAVEVVFYCALPLFAVLAVGLARGRTQRSSRRFAVLVPAFLVLAVGLSGKVAAVLFVPPATPYDDWGQNWHSVLVRSFWCQADLFAFGMALAVLRVESEDGVVRLPRWWPKAALLAAVAAYATAAGSGSRALSYSLENTFVAAACAFVLSLVVLPANRTVESRFVRILETRALVAVGVVSYSIFLWHEPLIRWLDEQGLTFNGHGAFLANLLVASAATGVASAITYRCVEAPALRLKFRRSFGARDSMPAAQVEAAP
jgi:peptidoglycan/LPS O-acetylase OafA/YrhL